MDKYPTNYTFSEMTQLLYERIQYLDTLPEEYRLEAIQELEKGEVGEGAIKLEMLDWATHKHNGLMEAGNILFGIYWYKHIEDMNKLTSERG